MSLNNIESSESLNNHVAFAPPRSPSSPTPTPRLKQSTLDAHDSLEASGGGNYEAQDEHDPTDLTHDLRDILLQQLRGRQLQDCAAPERNTATVLLRTATTLSVKDIVWRCSHVPDEG